MHLCEMFSTFPPTKKIIKRHTKFAQAMTVYPLTLHTELLNKTERNETENWTLCSGCTACCEYISLEIDPPTGLQDLDNIIWYLIHKNVWVWVDEEDKWYVQFNTPCEKLGASGRCDWYAHRPKICQDYKQSECPRYAHGVAEKFLFKDERAFIDWLARHRSKKLRVLLQRYLVRRAQRWTKARPQVSVSAQ